MSRPEKNLTQFEYNGIGIEIDGRWIRGIIQWGKLKSRIEHVSEIKIVFKLENT